MEIKKQLKSIKETASMIGCCEKSVYNYIKLELLKPVRIGGIKKAGRTFIHIDEIQRFLKG